MATLEQLRAVFGGTSDEDTILTAAQKLRMPVTDIANEVGFTAGGQWSNRFGGSIDNYQAGLYDVGSAATGALGLQGVSDWLGQRRQINERQSDFARQAAKEQGAVTSFKDIGGVGDAFNYLGGLAVDSAPYLGEALAGGLVARGAMTGTRAAMSAARELGMPAAVQAGQRSLARGSVAGAVAASYPSSVGDIMSNQREEAGVTDGATAALLGVPYAAANAFGLEGAAARAGLFRPAVNWFDQAGGIRGGLKRAGVTALTQGAQEGASETFQEVMNQAGRNAVNPAAGYTNPQAMERYLESFVGGGLLGGVAGAAGGGWRRSEGYKPPVSDNPLNPTDLLVVERGFDARKPLDGFAPEGPRPGSRVMAAPAEVPQWGLARGAMDPAPTHPTVGEATDLFRMPTDGEPRIVGGYDPRLAGLFVGPTQPGAAPFAFSPPLTGTAVPPLSPPVAVDPLGAATGPLYVDDVAEGNNRWREQPADIASPVIGRMESGRQIPISGADDPGLALARQRYEEQLRAAEEQKTKAAELQAQVEAAQARHAANRQAAVDALVDKKPDGSPVVPVRDREIATFTALRELHSAGVIDDATYADLAGRMREAYTLDDKMRPKALNAVAKEVASLKEQANAAGAGTDGAARPADVGRGAGDQRAPGERSGVRPAGAQPAAQGVASAGTTQLGPAGERGDGALTERPASAPVIATGTGDAVARVERAIGRTLTPEQRKLAIKLAGASPRTAQMLQDMLGLDAEWHQTGEPMSLREAAAKHGVSYEAVRKALKRLGISEEQLNAVRATDIQSMPEAELLANADEGGATGFRVTDKQLAGADDFELDARTQRDQRATDAFMRENDKAPSTAVVTEDPEILIRRQRAAAEGRARAEAEEAARRRVEMTNLVRSVPGVTREEVEEAGSEYDEAIVDLLDEEAAPIFFNDLDQDLRVAVVKLHRTMKAGASDLATIDRATKGIYSEQVDRARTGRAERRGERASGSAAQGGAGRVDAAGAGEGNLALAGPAQPDAEVAWADQLLDADQHPGEQAVDRVARAIQRVYGDEAVQPQEDKQADPNAPMAEKISAKPGANVVRMAKLLGPKLYGSPADLTKVSVKEMFQNAFDAVKAAIEGGSIKKGKIVIRLDKVTREITVIDNGSGMTPQVLANQFLQIAGTSKETGRASGGLGIAKMLFLYGNESLNVMTARDGKVATLVTSGEQLMAALDGAGAAPQIQIDPLKSTTAKLFPDGHGTAIIIKVPETFSDPSTGEQKAVEFPTGSYNFDVLQYSPLLDDIDVVFEGEAGARKLDIGSKFPIGKYTQLANAKFEWGTAHIYVTQKPEDVWGKNTHFLSNGLWQFSTALKLGAGWTAKNVRRTFYIDLSPTVTPEEPGYPFDLNRQQFSKTVEQDMNKVLKYISVLFKEDALVDETLSFGGAQYLDVVDGSVVPSSEQDLRPTVPQKGAVAALNAGDSVEVRDGKLLVNGRAVPDLTDKDLADAKIDVDALVIDQKTINPNRVMLHDNVQVPAAGARSETDLANEAAAAREAWFKGGETDAEEDALKERYETAKKALADYRAGKAAGDQVTPLSEAARAKFGARFDTFMYGIGDVFRRLRDAVADEMGYDELRHEAIGVSFDKEYRGVSIVAPFKGLFLNPAVPEYTDVVKAAYGMYGTMVHELAHHKVRSHDADFPAEMQRIMIHLAEAEIAGDFKATELQRELVRLVRDHHDVMMFLNERTRSDDSKPRGRRFKDGAQQAVSGGSGGDLDQSRQATGGGSGVPGGPPKGPPAGSQGANAAPGGQGGPRRQPVAAAQAAAKLTEALPQPAKNAWTDIKDFAARKLPYVMTTFQIFEQYGAKLKRLGDMIRANDLMRQESTALQMKVDDIVKRWDKLPKAAGELLSQVALRATMLGAHPDKAWAHEANAHVPRDRQGEYNELRQLYDRLKATSPEGVKLYHDALAAFEDQRQQLEKATERMFAQYGKVMPKVKRVPGPYFPLVRRGDYLAIGESPQLVALKKQLETLAGTEGNDEAIADLNSRIDQLEADGQHFWVSSHENRSGMENALKEYESRGLVGRRSMADQRLGALPTRNLHSTIAALTAEATKNLSKDGAKEVSNALAEILLRSLPEGHALERQTARKGVAGAMEDMKRAVAVAGRQNAYYIARLNHAKEVADALHEMGRDAKGDINLEHVYRELEQRHALNMQWHDTPWQDAIGKAAWTWFLGASPAFLAINAAQPWLVSAPVMAGEYGAGAATRELARATADAFKVMKQARWKDGKFDLWSGIDPDTVEGRFMTRNEKGEQVSEERKALRELIQRGVIDEGLNPELAMYAESGGTGLLTKLSRAFGWPAQQVELVNRVATALAAFRLERAKQGGRPDAYQKALDKAYATVVNTHVDYGAENAPRVMREGGGIPLAKLVFQFRRYQQAMMYLLASNVAKLRNPAEQKMARATLGYLALTSGMAGGVVGLPLAGTVMFLKDLFGDDDDEEGDAKARLRNTLYDLTGDKTLADVLAKGIPTLFGMDVAERAGMGQVAQMFPRLDLSRSKTAEDKLGKTLVAVAGPAGGLAVQGMDAASFFGAGDWVRGTERLLPKMMADPLRAARERVTGQEDRKGEQLMSSEELNYWDTIRRVAGVSSVRESDRLEADRALKSVEQGMNDRRSRIHAEFRRALRSGDFEDVRGMIDEYNADHPDMPIKPKDETAWRKEAQRAVSERDPETGLKVTRRQQPLAEVQRFARP